jgi:hypothetical protein
MDVNAGYSLRYIPILAIDAVEWTTREKYRIRWHEYRFLAIMDEFRCYFGFFNATDSFFDLTIYSTPMFAKMASIEYPIR